MKNQTSGKIAFVQACWHQDIVDHSRQGFAEKLHALNINAQVDYITVPGAFEIPLKIKQLLKSGDYALAIGAALVVDGGIYRHEFVAQTVVDALMQIQLELELPVLSVVLTPKETFREEDHHEFFFNHMKIKGAEAADVVGRLISDEMDSYAESA